jgi:poly(A) polymerase
MPIITPAFPSMNSTHNVSYSTCLVLLTELEKARRITSSLVDPNRNQKLTWQRLFKKFNFFKAYTHFLQIWILSKEEDTHEKWSGWAESKMRKFLTWLEKLSIKSKKCLEFRPWPKTENRLKDDEFEHSSAHYIGIRIRKVESGVPERIDLTDTVKLFYDTLNVFLKKDEKLKLLIDEKQVDIRISYHRRENLPDEVRPNITESAHIGKRRKDGEVDEL